MALSRLGHKYIVLFFLLSTSLLFYLIMFKVNPELDGSNGFEVIQLQLTFSVSKAQQIVSSWSDLSVEKFEYAMMLDSLYALSYGIFFTSLVSYVLHLKNMLETNYRYLIYLPFCASALDWIENAIEVVFINSLASISTTLFFFHSVAAILKWLCLPLLLLFILLLLKKKSTQ